MLTTDEVARITSDLDVTTILPPRADLIWVFGTAQATPAYLASELYLAGIARLVVLTGGANRRSGINEAEAHRDILLEHGVPSEARVVDNRSANTLENVQMALPLLAERIAISETRAVLTVAKWHHSRRAIMTLRQHLPEAITYYATTYEMENTELPQERIGRTNWCLGEFGLRRVLKEWTVIPTYLKAGHIAEVHGDVNGYH